MVSNFHGEKAFATYMRFLDAGPAERNQIITHEIPRNLGHAFVQDGEYQVKPVHELLMAGSIGDSTLIQTEMYNTIMQGAEPRKVMRNFIPFIPLTNGNSLKIPKGSVGAYAEDVAEGTEIKLQDQKYDPITVTVKKIGTRPMITKEMISDSQYNVIALEVSKAGARMENKLNRNILTALLDSGCPVHDTAGANQGSDAALEAQTIIEEADWVADKMAATPRFTAKVLRELLPAVNYSGFGADALQTGQIGPDLLGMTVLKTSVKPMSKTKAWGYKADGNIGAIVADSQNFAATVLREDIQVENYTDPIKQLQGAILTMRFETGILNPTAGCLIQF